jgi:hypothetical protein
MTMSAMLPLYGGCASDGGSVMRGMSAFGGKADIALTCDHVRF